MKIVIFDVGDAACALAVCANGYSMMIDCGDGNGKNCPVDQILENQDFLQMVRCNGYLLTLLHITHPDDDHVRNSKNLLQKMPPYLLHRRRYEEFSRGEIIHEDYKKHLDKRYRGNSVNFNEWSLSQNKTFRIPLEEIKTDPKLSTKEKNNSSILRFVEYAGIKVLFAGDLEVEGWEWLAQNNRNFVDTMKNGLNILVAAHHGHKSGFPKDLFNITGNVDTVIHSKGSEDQSIEGTSVSSNYASNANGIEYLSFSDKNLYKGKVLTTRSNGNIVIDVEPRGAYRVYTSSSPPRHEIVGAT